MSLKQYGTTMEFWAPMYNSEYCIYLVSGQLVKNNNDRRENYSTNTVITHSSVFIISAKTNPIIKSTFVLHCDVIGT